MRHGLENSDISVPLPSQDKINETHSAKGLENNRFYLLHDMVLETHSFSILQW